MSLPAIMWLILTPITFAVGFLLAWRQHKRRMQARINEVVAEELQNRMSEEVQKRVLQQLRGEAPTAEPEDGRHGKPDRRTGHTDPPNDRR